MRRALVCLWLTALSAGAQPLCPASIQEQPQYRSNLEVYSPQTQFSVIRTVPRAELTKEALKVRTGDTDGITLMQFEHKVTLSFQSTPEECKIPLIQVMLGARKALVYIAEEVSPDSCRFHVVYSHEMKHAAAAQRVFDTAARQLKKNIQLQLKEQEAGFVSDADLLALLETQAQVAIDAAVMQLNLENAKIDGDGEGERMTALCAPPTLKVGTGP